MTTEIEKLKTEQAKIKTRFERDRKRLSEINARLFLLEKQQELQAVIDVPNAVVVGHASRSSLRGQKATVRKVKRTRVNVEINGESWDMPLEFIKLDPLEAELEKMANAVA